MKMPCLIALLALALGAGERPLPTAPTQELKTPVEIIIPLNASAEWTVVDGEISRIYCDGVRFAALKYRLKDGRLQVKYRLENASGADQLGDLNFTVGAGPLVRVRGINIEDMVRDGDSVALPAPAPGDSLKIMIGVRSNA
jgi:hypothetical protein